MHPECTEEGGGQKGESGRASGPVTGPMPSWGELWERAMTQMLRPTHGNRPDDAVSYSDTEEAPWKVYS